MENRKQAAATLAALGAQIIFGFSFMFTKIALDYASPITVIANRYLVAFIGLSVVMLIYRQKLQLHKKWWKPLIMSLFQPVLYFVFETYGIRMTTSTFSSIMISIIPVVSMISGIFLLKEVPVLMQYVFTAMSVGGVVLCAMEGNASGTVTPLGTVLLIGAVFSSVGYNIASRKFSTEFSAFERTYAMTAAGMIFFVVVSLIENINNPSAVVTAFYTPEYTEAVFYLGIASSVVAFLLLNFANTHLPVAKTTVFSNVTTVVSVIAGAVFLKERLTLLTAFSAVMIITGVCGVQMLGMKKKRADS